MYSNILELPANVKAALDENDQNAWLKAFNGRIADAKPEDKGYADAYNDAVAGAWKDSMSLPSSRSFVAQISAELVDKQNEKVPVKDLLNIAPAYVAEGGLGHSEHTSIPTFTIWNADVGEDNETKRPSLIVYGNFYRGQISYDTGWKRFISGDESEFSTGTFAKRHYACDKTDGCYMESHPLQLFEVSTTKKGANPRTGVLWVHVPKGEGESNITLMDADFTLKSYNERADECPLKRNYLDFKEQVASFGVDTLWEDGAIYLHGGELGKAQEAVKAHFPDAYVSEVMPEDDGTLSQTIVLLNKVAPTSSHDFVWLITDELEAINGYKAVIAAVKQSPDIDDESKKYAEDKLVEIINDEVDHARIDYDLLVRFAKVLPVESAADTEQEIAPEVATKALCPEGQHEHPGIIGCHDMNQVHDAPKHVAPSDKVNVSNENINLDAIRNADTPRLQNFVRSIAVAMQGHSADEVSQFMASPLGKEFTLMMLELHRRKGDGTMNEKTKADATEVPPASVPAVPEATVKSEDETTLGGEESPNTLARLTELMAAMSAKLEVVYTKVMALQSEVAASGGNSESIENAVGDAVGALGGGNETEGGKGTTKSDTEEGKDEGKTEGGEGKDKPEGKDGDGDGDDDDKGEGDKKPAEGEVKSEGGDVKKPEGDGGKGDEKKPAEEEKCDGGMGGGKPPFAGGEGGPKGGEGKETKAEPVKKADEGKGEPDGDENGGPADKQTAPHKEPDGDEPKGGEGAKPAEKSDGGNVGGDGKPEAKKAEVKAEGGEGKVGADEKCNGGAGAKGETKGDGDGDEGKDGKLAVKSDIAGVPADADTMTRFLGQFNLAKNGVAAEFVGVPGRMDSGFSYKSMDSDTVVVKPTDEVPLANVNLYGTEGNSDGVPQDSAAVYKALLHNDRKTMTQYDNIFKAK